MNYNNQNIIRIRWLTYMMFLMFAMTTDAVGVIIPELMEDFSLSMTEAGLVHYAPMVAIAVAGLGFGFLADRIGRKITIVLGLSIFSAVSFLFLAGDQFGYFLSLMVISGLAIGVFKTAALALIGDISLSNREHTSTVNGVEAFFAVGAIIGPLLVTYLLSQGVNWKWLYAIAGMLCMVLVILSLITQYPPKKERHDNPVNLRFTLKMLKDPYVLGFSLGAFLYVATESAIYVWMPTYIKGYEGPFLLLSTYALTIFFVLRALGRFLGMWLLERLSWSGVLVLCSGAIAVCFVLSIVYGKAAAVFLLPVSGLFMSIIYPTLNSKGISCFDQTQHGTVAGIILFFTAAGAAAGPLLMGLVSDAYGGDAKYGFMVATAFALILFAGLLYNWWKKPVLRRLAAINWQVASR